MPSEIKTSDIENVDWSTGTSGPHYQNVVRFGSSSSQASQSSGDICRICHCESDPQNPLLTPCYCSGSLKYVHQACLQQWLTASETNACELCKFPFIMHTKIKPFNEWRSLDMSGVERRRLCCAVLFHCAAALCVIWSLCVLIERAAEEVKRGLIGWPFWTKLAVVTVGLTGGVVFMYIQCRQYLHLCHRWRARNRILLIQNAPERIHPQSPPSPVMTTRHLPRNNSATAASAMTTNSCNYSNYGCTSAGNRSSSGILHTSNNPNVPQHGQIVANIENNSQNYDRDWTLDDVSQISSFRPCPQGSGSMTPFHDSVHNALENSVSCSNSISGSRQDLNNLMPNSSNCSNRSNEVDAFKTTSAATAAPAGNATAITYKYPNCAVFLENRDILNDGGYPKINYRHSSILMSPEINDNLDKFLGKDLRRYSDTKLLQRDTDVLSPIFNVAVRVGTAADETRSRTLAHPKMKSGKSNNNEYVSQNSIGAPQITEIIFENATPFEATELNQIHELLELDGQYPYGVAKKSRHSLNHVPRMGNDPADDEKFDKSRLFFKSLPNLSSSCESLIKK